MNEADLFKMAQKYDEDFMLSDFNSANVEEENKIIEKTQNGEQVGVNFNKNYVKSVNKPNFKQEKAEEKTNIKAKKAQKNKPSNARFKEQYFGYYDDIKTSSNHKTEW